MAKGLINLYRRGSTERGLREALSNIGEVTEVREFVPSGLTLYSVIKAEWPNITSLKIEPDRISAKNLLSEKSLLKDKPKIFDGPSFGLTEEDFKDIKAYGLFFSYEEEGCVPEVFFPQVGFMESFSKAIHVGKLDEGFAPTRDTSPDFVPEMQISLARDLYIGHLLQKMDDAHNILGIVRMNDSGAGAWTDCTPKNFEYVEYLEKLDVIEDSIPDLSVVDWKIDRNGTEVTFRINNSSLIDPGVYPGYEPGMICNFSDAKTSAEMRPVVINVLGEATPFSSKIVILSEEEINDAFDAVISSFREVGTILGPILDE